MGAPNFFISLDELTCGTKISTIMECFATQKDKHWFCEDTFHALLRLRGMESNNRHAEAFYCRKAIL